MDRTIQQQAFIDEVITGKKHIALVARAGTGKTTTILEAVADYAKQFPKHEIVICAFGKGIATEIQGKLKKRGLDDWRKFQASTSHAMGFGLMRVIFKDIKVNDDKVRDLIRAQNDPTFDIYFSQIKELVHLAKVEGFGFFDDCQIGDTHAWYRMADHYNVNGFDDTTDMDRVIEAAIKIYRLSLDFTTEVDFDDMVLWPLIKNIRVRFGKDLVIVDEAQDTSRARRALLKKFLKPTGRMIVVGDDRQAIMGFAGASADAMGELIRELQPVVLPLTVTWRCPKAVVREAQKIVPDIEAAEGAIEGSLTTATELPAELLPTDAILCRNNAPLVETAYSLIRRRIPCKVEGREIGNNLLRMVDRWKVKTIAAFLNKLEDWQARETQKALAKGKDSKVEEINDRCDTLIVICQAVQAKQRQDLEGVREFVRDLFADDVKSVLTLASGHRSKGREWPRVFLLDFAKRRYSPYDKQEWQRAQADNVAYVMLTRAQEDMIYVDRP